MSKDLRNKSAGVEISAFFMILKIFVSNLCFFYDSLWSKFSFVSLAVIFLKFLDGIKEKTLSIKQGIILFYKFQHLCL